MEGKEAMQARFDEAVRSAVTVAHNGNKKVDTAQIMQTYPNFLENHSMEELFKIVESIEPSNEQV